jgi:hypothetical protein
MHVEHRSQCVQRRHVTAQPCIDEAHQNLAGAKRAGLELAAIDALQEVGSNCRKHQGRQHCGNAKCYERAAERLHRRLLGCWILQHTLGRELLTEL